MTTFGLIVRRIVGCLVTTAALTAGFGLSSYKGWPRQQQLTTMTRCGTTKVALSGRDITADEQSRRNFIASVSTIVWMATQLPCYAATASDEIKIDFPVADLQKGLGIELADIEFQTNLRVVVKSVNPNSQAAKAGIQANWIVVSLNGQSMERTNAAGVKQTLVKAITDSSGQGVISFTFRDPSLFKSKLENLSTENGPVTTQVAPAGDTTQRLANGDVRPGSVVTSADQAQVVTVEQLEAPKLCNRGADIDDLLEISYTGSIVETGDIFDGSSIAINGKEIPGRGSDTTLYFVLGKQPFGQFPPSWDVGLTGMCVGERRRLTIPPVLAYGSKGFPRRKIPPNATLQYDISLISINGLATLQ